MSGHAEDRKPCWSVTGEGRHPCATWYPDLAGGIVVIDVGRLGVHLTLSDATCLVQQLRTALSEAGVE